MPPPAAGKRVPGMVGPGHAGARARPPVCAPAPGHDQALLTGAGLQPLHPLRDPLRVGQLVGHLFAVHCGRAGVLGVQRVDLGEDLLQLGRGGMGAGEGHAAAANKRLPPVHHAAPLAPQPRQLHGWHSSSTSRDASTPGQRPQGTTGCCLHAKRAIRPWTDRGCDRGCQACMLQGRACAVNWGRTRQLPGQVRSPGPGNQRCPCPAHCYSLAAIAAARPTGLLVDQERAAQIDPWNHGIQAAGPIR
jgi:hypothetical protein